MLSSQEVQRLDLTLNQHGKGSDYKSISKSLRRIPHRSLLDTVKRKSRSADALREMARSQNTLQAQERRLSDEIKYWRNSIVEDPLPSLSSSRQETTEEVEESHSSSSLTAPPSLTHIVKDSPPRPQAFDFSGLMTGGGDASVEQRITTVEVKLIDLECAIANLQDSDTSQSAVLARPPRRRQALPDLNQLANMRSFSTSVLYPQSSFDSFSTSSSTSEDKEDQTNEHRNSIANTIRPDTTAQPDTSTTIGRPPTPAQTNSEEEFAKLITMLTQEQEARRGLESQLKDLQKQINDLRFPAISRGPPTPGHFSNPTCNMMDSSPISTKRCTILPFRTATPRMILRKRSSQKENEEDETDTDDGFLDVYETPMEAREYGFGINAPRSSPMVGVM